MIVKDLIKWFDEFESHDEKLVYLQMVGTDVICRTVQPIEGSSDGMCMKRTRWLFGEKPLPPEDK